MTIVGDRVELIRCDDPYTRLKPGTCGTVTFIDSMGTVAVDWDDGSRLGLVAQAGDAWKVVGDVDEDPVANQDGRTRTSGTGM